jgi:hypothetical protein
MRNLVAGTMTVLGALLVLTGSAITVLRALNQPEPAGDAAVAVDPAPAGSVSRLKTAVRRMPPVERLIAWGFVLLVVGAVAAGAISFNFGADAGTR